MNSPHPLWEELISNKFIFASNMQQTSTNKATRAATKSASPAKKESPKQGSKKQPKVVQVPSKGTTKPMAWKLPMGALSSPKPLELPESPSRTLKPPVPVPSYTGDDNDIDKDSDLEWILNEYHRQRPLTWDFSEAYGTISNSVMSAWNHYASTGDERDLVAALHGMHDEDARHLVKSLYNHVPGKPLVKSDFIKRNSAPVAFSSELKGSTGVSVTAFNHKTYGPAIHMEAKIPIGYIRNVFGTCTATPLGTAGWISNSIKVGPDSLGGRAASLAALWSRWGGDHFKFDYIPGCATSTPGSLVLYFTNDPTSNPALIGTIETALQCQPSVMNSAWAPSQLIAHGHPEDPLLFTEGTTADGGDESRLTCMGLFGVVGVGLDPTPSSSFLGTITVCFALDLYSPVPNNGITAFVDLQREIGAYNSEHLVRMLLDPITRNRFLELTKVIQGPMSYVDDHIAARLRDTRVASLPPPTKTTNLR